MTLIDRSKFKGTSLNKMKERDQEVSNMVGVKENNNSRVNVIKIDEGRNEFRLCPANPDIEDSTTVESKVVRFMPYLKPERDKDNKIIKDNKGNVQTKLTVKPIFDARIHGGASKDLVEEYIKKAERIAAENFPDEAGQAKFLLPIVGNKLKGGNVPGIASRQSWVCYAYKIEGEKMTFGELEFSRAVQRAINRIAGQEQLADEPMDTDLCFTDIEEGRSLIVSYDKSAKPNDKYVCSIDNTQVTVQLANGRNGKSLKTYPMSDEQLTELMKAPPLLDYRKMFKRSDLDLQLEGLVLFEEANPKFNILNDPEFAEIVAELQELWPEETKDEEGNASSQSTSNDEYTGDQFDLMNKAELKEFALENGTGIIMKATWTEDIMKGALRQWVADQEEELGNAVKEDKAATPAEDEDDNFDPNENDEQDPGEEEKPKVTAGGLRNQASNLRNKFGTK